MATQIRNQTIQSQTGEQTFPAAGSRLERHERFASRSLPGERGITVYLPPGYDAEAERRYPLLILQDGQNLFDGERSFVRGRTWQVAESAEREILGGAVEPLVIAGIDHGGERRLAEYTPSRDWRQGGGEAGRYAEMLLGEVLPFLHGRYRLRSGAEETGVGGSSLGGLVSLWLGLRHPEVFGKLGVLSPSVWWNHCFILNWMDGVPPCPRRPRIWLDVGDGEGQRTAADAEALAAKLKGRGAELRFEVVAGGRHEEAAWARRVGPMLGYLFPSSP